MTVLYCVIQSDRAPGAFPGTVPGLPGAAPPRVLPLAGGLAAVVATLPDDEYDPESVNAKLRDMEWVSRAAIGHEQVIDAMMAAAPAVLPMKLLTLFSSDARLTADLKTRRPKLSKAAARVSGCQEFGLRVTPAGPAGGPASDDDAKPAAADRPPSGLAFLERKKAARDQSRERAGRQAAFAREAWEALAGAARDAVQRPIAGDAIERPLLDAAFLVGAGERDAFARASERLAAAAGAAGCAVTLTGPWPPYHFVQA